MKKLLLAMLALAMMAGCTSEPSKPAQTEKPQPKPPEYLTGRAAFQKLYIAAHGWARDAQPYRIESVSTADSKGKDGKSTVWRAFFASALQHGVKPYVWSGEDSSDAPSRGISPGSEDNYNPTNSSTHVFDVAFLKNDSDKALEVAQKHGGDKLLAKTPDTPILVHGRLESTHGRTHLARDLRRQSVRSQAESGGECQYRRIHSRGKIEDAGFSLSTMNNKNVALLAGLRRGAGFQFL